MEGAPDKIDLGKLVGRLRAIENVDRVHDFHLWSISVGTPSLSCHITCEGEAMKVLSEAMRICKEEFKIDHITIQVEDSTDPNCPESCAQNTHASFRVSKYQKVNADGTVVEDDGAEDEDDHHHH